MGVLIDSFHLFGTSLFSKDLVKMISSGMHNGTAIRLMKRKCRLSGVLQLEFFHFMMRSQRSALSNMTCMSAVGRGLEPITCGTVGNLPSSFVNTVLNASPSKFALSSLNVIDHPLVSIKHSTEVSVLLFILFI